MEFSRNPRRQLPALIYELPFPVSTARPARSPTQRAMNGKGHQGRRSPKVGQQIKERFADGAWHKTEEMARTLDINYHDVLDTLTNIIRHKTFGLSAERKTIGSGDTLFRLHKQDKMVSVKELTEKIRPIIKDLERQGSAHMANWSPATIAFCASRLRKYLKDWGE
jgi:hypothetical protein